MPSTLAVVSSYHLPIDCGLSFGILVTAVELDDLLGMPRNPLDPRLYVALRLSASLVLFGRRVALERSPCRLNGVHVGELPGPWSFSISHFRRVLGFML